MKHEASTSDHPAERGTARAKVDANAPAKIVELDPLAIYRCKTVLPIAGTNSRVTLWRRIRSGQFPAPIQLGVNSIGWRGEDLISWRLSLRPVTWARNAPEKT